MAITQQYPRKTPKSNDSVLGTSVPDPNTNDDPKNCKLPYQWNINIDSS